MTQAEAAQQKRACIHTLGCRLNQAESAILEEKLKAAGYVMVPFGEPADLGIIHTCTVTREADTKSRKLIRQFTRNNPDAFTAVIGCYAQMRPESINRLEGVDLIIGNQEKMNLLAYLGAGKNPEPVVVCDPISRKDFRIEFTGHGPIAHRPNLKIQDGCDFLCSYCIIPFARGRIRSREMENLLDEARSLIGRGAKELVLTGINVGTYGYGGASILDVVDRLNELDELPRIRISSIEPTTIPEALFDRMRDPAHALLPYLHIPLQSGSDRILAAMRRQYTRAAFLDFVAMAHARVPGIGIGTDVMVGFPGEQEEDFEDTCSLLEQSPVFYAHVFKYSERAGTASARMQAKVDPKVLNRRSAAVRALSARKTRAFAEAHVDAVVTVLFEQLEGAVWTGYTGNYLRVAARSEENLRNEIRRVKLERLEGEALHGTVLE